MTPTKLQSLLQQAVSHHQAGRLAAAAGLYAQVRTLAPRQFEGFHLGGAVALQLGQIAEAEKLLATALALNPRAATTHMCLGLAQAAAGRGELAEKSLRQSLQLDPKNPEAWVHLASICSIASRFDEAAEAYERCLKLQPKFAQAWAGLGSILHLRGKHTEAIAHFDKALALDPNHPKARASRAQARLSLHQVAEARADFEAHLKKFPDDLESRSYRLFLLNYTSELSRTELFAEHQAFGTAATAAARKTKMPVAAGVPTVAPTPGRKISVAFLSPDLRTHSVAFFLEPLLRHLDRERFEITLYHDHFSVDDTSRRLQALAGRWRNFIGQTADVVEKRIREDAPDILVDLAGHTGFNRLPLFARRLVPVQITYLGYPNTTGLAEMNYRFTDALADPPGESDALHTERLVRFAPTAWCYEPPATAPAPNLQPGRAPTFGSFNNLSKLSLQTLRLWAKVLAAVPGSRLLLKGSGLSPELLTPRLAAAGLDPARIDLLPATPTLAEHLATYSRVDVALDPFPYHGTTTTCEALWMGVPVVTLAGDRHASRVGASLLTAAGHPEWVTQSEDDYVRTAAALIGDAARLAALRSGLRADLRRSPLLDHAGQAARFGEALLQCREERFRPNS